MKKPITWHRECLANAERSLAEREASLAREAVSVERDRASLAFRRRQIEEAETRGLAEFDSERLLVKRSA